MTVVAFAKRYAALGMVPLPIPAGGKRATVTGWSDPKRIEFIVGADGSVAVRLDHHNDIDCDCIEAIQLAPALLPATPARTMRPSVGSASHYYYKGTGTAKYLKFEDPLGGTILEFRTGASHYTLAPPSVLPASKGSPAEAIVWCGMTGDDVPEPSAPDEEGQIRSSKLCAAAALLVRGLGVNGFGHDVRLEFAGFARKLGWILDEAIEVGEAMSIPCNNTEFDDVAASVRSTYAKPEGDAIKGGPSLAKRMDGGDRRIAAIMEWFLGKKKRRADDVEFTRPEGVPPLTESGDAEHFAKLNGALVRYDHRRARWLVFQGHAWRPQTDGEIDRLALDAVRDRQKQALEMTNEEARKACLKWAIGGESAARRNNLLRLSESVRPLATDGAAWDLDPWLLGTPGGILDLRTGEMRDGHPDDNITMLTRAEFNRDAECPDWDAIILEIFGGDPEMVAYFDRFVGYSLTADTREESLAVCFGSGANGKGTLMNTLGYALGEYTDDLPFSTFEQSARSGGIPNDIAKLVNKRFVTSSETNESTRLNEARIKALTGRDPITARFLHQEFFTFQPVAKFWLATNHRPIVTDDSPGFWRRIQLIPFEQSFEGREDKTLKERLRGQVSGILARAVRGCLAWQERGLDPPKQVKLSTQSWREESDVLQPFLEERCVLLSGLRVQASALYADYVDWARHRGSKDPLSQKGFGTKMKRTFLSEEGRHTHYLGIGLRQDNNRGEM